MGCIEKSDSGGPQQRMKERPNPANAERKLTSVGWCGAVRRHGCTAGGGVAYQRSAPSAAQPVGGYPWYKWLPFGKIANCRQELAVNSESIAGATCRHFDTLQLPVDRN